jgi:hypothetical protein
MMSPSDKVTGASAGTRCPYSAHTQQTGYWSFACKFKFLRHILNKQQPETDALLNAQHPVYKTLAPIENKHELTKTISYEEWIINYDLYDVSH